MVVLRRDDPKIQENRVTDVGQAAQKEKRAYALMFCNLCELRNM